MDEQPQSAPTEMQADLAAPQFTRADVAAVTMLSPRNVQAYTDRGLITLCEQHVGKGNPRLYSIANVFTLDLIRRLGNHPFMVPPGPAADLAIELIEQRVRHVHNVIAPYILQGVIPPSDTELNAIAIIYLDEEIHTFHVSVEIDRLLGDMQAALDQSAGVVSLIAIDQIYHECLSRLLHRKGLI